MPRPSKIQQICLLRPIQAFLCWSPVGVPIVVGLALFFLPSLVLAETSPSLSDKKSQTAGPEDRVRETSTKLKVVSLAPSITETIFSLGAGSSLTGRTIYCQHPPGARHLPEVGGLLDTDLERLISLKPSHIFLLEGHPVTAHARLLNSELVSFKQDRLNEISNSIVEMSKILGVKAKGLEIKERIEREITKGPKLEKAESFLLLLSTGSGQKVKLAAGSNNYLSDLLLAMGLTNSYKNNKGFSPISIEGIYSLNPDLIIELLPPELSLNTESQRTSWKENATLKAIKNKRVFIFKDELLFKPGPRIIDAHKLLYKKLSR